MRESDRRLILDLISACIDRAAADFAAGDVDLGDWRLARARELSELLVSLAKIPASAEE